MTTGERVSTVRAAVKSLGTGKVRVTWVLGLVVLAASAAISLAQAPTPKSTPPRWELQFKVGYELRLVQIGRQYYWFMTCLVTNRTAQDQTFVPSAVLYTDAGDIIVESRDVPHEVTLELLDMIGNPLLETSTQVIGQIQIGKENAREVLFLWKAGSLDIDDLSVFISGLSSETQVAVNPATNEEVIVRKTIQRHYLVPGEPTANIQSPVVFDSQRWIMR